MRSFVQLGTLFICLFSTAVFAVDSSKVDGVAELLHKVRQGFEKESFAFEIQVNSYEKINSAESKPYASGRIVKGKNTYYSKYLNEEMLFDGKTVLAVNHTNLSISVSQTKDEQSVSSGLNVNFDSLLKQNDNVHQIKLSTGEIKVTLSTKGAIIERTEIFIDSSTSGLNKIIYYYHNDYQSKLGMAKMEIIYKKKEVGKVPSVSDFVSNKGGNWLLKSKYQNYYLNVIKD